MPTTRRRTRNGWLQGCWSAASIAASQHQTCISFPRRRGNCGCPNVQVVRTGAFLPLMVAEHQTPRPVTKPVATHRQPQRSPPGPPCLTELNRKPVHQVGRWIESQPPGNEHELDLRTAVESCTRSLPRRAWLIISRSGTDGSYAAMRLSHNACSSPDAR